MKHRLPGGAAALLTLSLAAPAMAQDEVSSNGILVESTLLHPAAGLMNEHMHDGGEAMIGLRFERRHSGGTNQSGNSKISDAEILAAGYAVRTASMEMDMVMLDLMYAPTDDITLMVMPHYMWHRMTMVGIDPAAGMGGDHGGHSGHGGMGLPFGQAHEHESEGFGDTLVSASWRLARTNRFGAHATLGLWLPTGAVDKTNPNGTLVHYGMQPGSGTWDLEPALTTHGRSGAAGWGVQAAYRWRLDEANRSGYRLGDVARATGWVSYAVSPVLGTTARLEYVHQGKVEGHYNAAHNHSAPPDLQANYGGDVVSAAIGMNLLLPVSATPPQIGLEFGVPLYQDLNGIQAPEDWRLSISLSREF